MLLCQITPSSLRGSVHIEACSFLINILGVRHTILFLVSSLFYHCFRICSFTRIANLASLLAIDFKDCRKYSESDLHLSMCDKRISLGILQIMLF